MFFVEQPLAKPVGLLISQAGQAGHDLWPNCPTGPGTELAGLAGLARLARLARLSCRTRDLATSEQPWQLDTANLAAQC